MEYKGYTIDIRINNTLLEMQPSEFSFSIKDSIHDFFPKGRFVLNDTSGLFHEYQLLIEGIPIEISYGMGDDLTSCRYIVERNETPNIQTPGIMSGNIKTILIHEYFNNQEKISTSYSGTISGIITKVLNYSYSNTQIEETQNNGRWYRPLLTEEKFIQGILMPNAYSLNSEKTPLFSFTNTNNVFNFLSFKNMYNQNVKGDFTYNTQTIDTFSSNTILDIKPFSRGLDNTYDSRNIDFEYMSMEDGSIIVENDSFLNHPIQEKDSFFIGDSSLTTNVIFGGDYYTDKFQKENRIGQKINFFRNYLFFNKLVITLPLNVLLHAGDTINITSYSYDSSGKITSQFYSDKYFIEQSEHVWDGINQRGYTQLVVGRKEIKLSSDYLVKEDLFK